MIIRMMAAGLLIMASVTAYVVAQAPPAFEDILKIDAHVHIFDDVPELAEMLQRTNSRVINICLYGTRPEILLPAQLMAQFLQAQYPDSFYFVATFDLTQRDQPDYAEQVIAWIDVAVDGGALMVKLWKEVGMELKRPDGKYLMPDDPLFDPIYAHLADRGIPLLVHAADPIDAWKPLTPASPHYNYYRDNPQWHVYGRDGMPSHEALMEARDNIMVKHSDLVVVGAHFGSLTHDLDALAERLDRFPNFHVDVSARVWLLSSYPAKDVRDFFINYQDRILYGTDIGRYTEGRESTEEERVAFVNSLEATYRRDYEFFAEAGMRARGNRESECLGLPSEVLEKLYHKNAQRLMPGLAD